MVASAAEFDELISHGYKPLKRVQGSLPYQVRLQSRESKDEDTRKYGKMVKIKKNISSARYKTPNNRLQNLK